MAFGFWLFRNGFLEKSQQKINFFAKKPAKNKYYPISHFF
jgi:hypothetical protein